MPPFSISRTLVIATLAVASLGCRAQRELVITSEPPGAEIRLDGRLLAEKTPAHVPFKDYGVRRISIYHDGYIRYSEAFDVRAPWYAQFPIDVLSEIVLPIGWHDRHKLRVKLVRGDTRIAAPDLLKVLQRAESLRKAGPEGPERELKEPHRLPRETTGQNEVEPATPAPKPTGPPASGGGE